MRDSRLTTTDRNESRRALRALAPKGGYRNQILLFGTLFSIPSVLYTWYLMAPMVSQFNTYYSQNQWLAVFFETQESFSLLPLILTAMLVIIVCSMIAAGVQLLIDRATAPARQQTVRKSLEQSRFKNRIN